MKNVELTRGVGSQGVPHSGKRVLVADIIIGPVILLSSVIPIIIMIIVATDLHPSDPFHRHIAKWQALTVTCVNLVWIYVLVRRALRSFPATDAVNAYSGKLPHRNLTEFVSRKTILGTILLVPYIAFWVLYIPILLLCKRSIGLDLMMAGWVVTYLLSLLRHLIRR